VDTLLFVFVEVLLTAEVLVLVLVLVFVLFEFTVLVLVELLFVLTVVVVSWAIAAPKSIAKRAARAVFLSVMVVLPLCCSYYFITKRSSPSVFRDILDQKVLFLCNCSENTTKKCLTGTEIWRIIESS
jgi:hypothetical protein